MFFLVEQSNKIGVFRHKNTCKINDLRSVPEKRTTRNKGVHFPLQINDLLLFLEFFTMEQIVII